METLAGPRIFLVAKVDPLGTRDNKVAAPIEPGMKNLQTRVMTK